MSYHLYTTPALVLGAYQSGKSHKRVILLTKDLGLIVAHVQSGRELRSKLKTTLDLFSYSRVSLIRGRTDWRLTGTESVEHLVRLRRIPERRVAVARMGKLLTRFIHGEEVNESLFETILSACLYLEREEEDAVIDFEALDITVSLKVLALLGYLDEGKILPEENKNLLAIAESPVLSHEVLAMSRREKLVSEALIHKAVLASQL
jgi:recombinational DNA repair protein (RecF pathway)